ncbi:unnamed protein product [Ixodes pacificus]
MVNSAGRSKSPSKIRKGEVHSVGHAPNRRVEDSLEFLERPARDGLSFEMAAARTCLSSNLTSQLNFQTTDNYCCDRVSKSHCTHTLLQEMPGAFSSVNACYVAM